MDNGKLNKYRDLLDKVIENLIDNRDSFAKLLVGGPAENLRVSLTTPNYTTEHIEVLEIRDKDYCLRLDINV